MQSWLHVVVVPGSKLSNYIYVNLHDQWLTQMSVCCHDYITIYTNTGDIFNTTDFRIGRIAELKLKSGGGLCALVCMELLTLRKIAIFY